MIPSSYSVTIDLEDNPSYRFLNNLRLTYGNNLGAPAHITVVSSLKVTAAELPVLQRLLTVVAGRIAPFNLSFHDVELLPPRRPYRRHCVTVLVSARGSLLRVWRNISSQ